MVIRNDRQSVPDPLSFSFRHPRSRDAAASRRQVHELILLERSQFRLYNSVRVYNHTICHLQRFLAMISCRICGSVNYITLS